MPEGEPHNDNPKPLPQSTIEAMKRSRATDNAIYSIPEWQEDKNFLQSEDIPDSEHYKQYIPAFKSKFNEFFKFEPRLTNSFIMDLHDFLNDHADEDSGDKIERWIVGEYIYHYSKPGFGAKDVKAIEDIADQEVTDEKLKIFYVWVLQNIPVKQK